MKLIGDWVLIEPIRRKEVTKGLSLQMESTERFEGFVRDHGKGVKGNPISVTSGDKVIYKDGAWSRFKLDGMNCLFVREINIVSIL